MLELALPPGPIPPILPIPIPPTNIEIQKDKKMKKSMKMINFCWNCTSFDKKLKKTKYNFFDLF